MNDFRKISSKIIQIDLKNDINFSKELGIKSIGNKISFDRKQSSMKQFKKEKRFYFYHFSLFTIFFLQKNLNVAK